MFTKIPITPFKVTSITGNNKTINKTHKKVLVIRGFVGYILVTINKVASMLGLIIITFSFSSLYVSCVCGLNSFMDSIMLSKKEIRYGLLLLL